MMNCNTGCKAPRFLVACLFFGLVTACVPIQDPDGTPAQKVGSTIFINPCIGDQEPGGIFILPWATSLFFDKEKRPAAASFVQCTMIKMCKMVSEFLWKGALDSLKLPPEEQNEIIKNFVKPDSYQAVGQEARQDFEQGALLVDVLFSALQKVTKCSVVSKIDDKNRLIRLLKGNVKNYQKIVSIQEASRKSTLQRNELSATIFKQLYQNSTPQQQVALSMFLSESKKKFGNYLTKICWLCELIQEKGYEEDVVAYLLATERKEILQKTKEELDILLQSYQRRFQQTKLPIGELVDTIGEIKNTTPSAPSSRGKKKKQKVSSTPTEQSPQIEPVADDLMLPHTNTTSITPTEQPPQIEPVADDLMLPHTNTTSITPTEQPPQIEPVADDTMLPHTNITKKNRQARGRLEKELKRRYKEKGYTLHSRVERWDESADYRIRKFKDRDQYKYKHLSPQELNLQKEFHHLPGVPLLRCLENQEDYFFTTPQGRSAFAELKIGETIYSGVLELGISRDRVIYHVRFNPLFDTKEVQPEKYFEIMEPAFQKLEDTPLNEGPTQPDVPAWIHITGYQISPVDHTYVIQYPHPGTRPSQQSYKTLTIRPHGFW